jgi:predicted membrane channel-forming protein YqfA (hemolysin III family)
MGCLLLLFFLFICVTAALWISLLLIVGAIAVLGGVIYTLAWMIHNYKYPHHRVSFRDYADIADQWVAKIWAQRHRRIF